MRKPSLYSSARWLSTRKCTVLITRRSQQTSTTGRGCRAIGKYDEADPLYQRALAIDEKALGPYHPDVASDLNNRAGLLRAQGKYEEAEPLYERSQAIREKALGPEHPAVATVLNNRAGLLSAQVRRAKQR
ncbi:unnamed protein product [Ectocarpus sp. 12 AP-2014]